MQKFYIDNMSRGEVVVGVGLWPSDFVLAHQVYVEVHLVELARAQYAVRDVEVLRYPPYLLVLLV